MEIKVYNTLTRKKETFVPIKEGFVGMYSCGPTVYKPAHIGNMRSYIFMDTLRRMFEYNGYKVKSVMNITDVGHLLSDADSGEDKLEKSAREENLQPLQIAKRYTDLFFHDIDELNILRPTVSPRATDNIKEMIDIVSRLLELGFAYETDDGIYFSVEKFPEYGKLSRINLEEQLAGARVEVNSTKRSPVDFALWKKAEPNHIMKWDSPWGLGYPGWHIECTAMSKKYLGEVFDIHTGGVDHIPIHHENEIAQSECCYGKKTTNYWMHNEFMLFDGGKMSKSLGNTYTVGELCDKGYTPMDFRYFCLNTHYRQKMNFTFDALDASKVAFERLGNLLLSHKDSADKTNPDLLYNYEQEFHRALNDDLNVSMGIGVLWTMLKEPKSKDIYDLALKFDRALGLRLDKIVRNEVQSDELSGVVNDYAKQREIARNNRNWAESDRLRDLIVAEGYTVSDTSKGQIVKKN